MNRPFLVRLADVVAFFAVTYLLLSLTTTLMMSFGKLPGPNNWIAMLVGGVIGIGCSNALVIWNYPQIAAPYLQHWRSRWDQSTPYQSSY
ncbi:hypothetical protein [Paraburkholderia sp. A1RO-5L]|uniref:hypothetical protein n=1 Tax=Paraburkholderia sp. A1RO-5L TaxID=3028370 RepID=UPI003B9869E1